MENLEELVFELEKVGTEERQYGKVDVSCVKGRYLKNGTPEGNLEQLPAGKYVAFPVLFNVVILKPFDEDSGNLSSKHAYAVYLVELIKCLNLNKLGLNGFDKFVILTRLCRSLYPACATSPWLS